MSNSVEFTISTKRTSVPDADVNDNYNFYVLRELTPLEGSTV